MQYGLIGKKLSHSYSCEIHSFLASYNYELCELAPQEVEDFFKKRLFNAVNVTIPYKETVIPYLDFISQKAKAVGAVNTVVNKNGKLYGYNTDFDGMCALLEHNNIIITGKKVLILGTGGTSKTALAVAKHLKAGQVIQVSRNPVNNQISYDEALNSQKDAQIIINTTPVGMYPNIAATPIDISSFTLLEGIIDAIYNPLRTVLVSNGQKPRIKSTGGLYMLAAQAVYASALFLNKTASMADIDKAYNGVLNQKQNIVLIGMPSSGKTTIGKILSQKTGFSFVDTDDEIVSEAGITISELFKLHGEKAFRQTESNIIERISKSTGSIISTGGGAVLDKKNIFMLKQNGITVFIDRSPKNLCATPDRPLAMNKDAITKLYNDRYNIYKASANITVDGDLSAEAVADNIIKAVYK